MKNNRSILSFRCGGITYYALSKVEDNIQPGDIVKLPGSPSVGVVIDIAQDYSGECLRMLSHANQIYLDVVVAERKFSYEAAST